MKQYNIHHLENPAFAQKVCDALAKRYVESMPVSGMMHVIFGVAQDHEKKVVVDLTCDTALAESLLTDIRGFAAGFETGMKTVSDEVYKVLSGG